MGLAFTLDSDPATASSSAHYRGDTSRCARDISTACLVLSGDDDDDRKMMR